MFPGSGARTRTEDLRIMIPTLWFGDACGDAGSRDWWEGLGVAWRVGRSGLDGRWRGTGDPTYAGERVTNDRELAMTLKEILKEAGKLTVEEREQLKRELAVMDAP